MPPKKIPEFELQHQRGTSFISFVYSYNTDIGEPVRCEFVLDRLKSTGKVNIYRGDVRLASARETRTQFSRQVYDAAAFEELDYDSGFPFLRPLDPVYEKAIDMLKCINVEDDAGIDAMLYALQKRLKGR